MSDNIDSIETLFSMLDLNDRTPLLGAAAEPATSMDESIGLSDEVGEASSSSFNKMVKGDHPEGDEIRRQVEFYFSDENLPNDSHLRSLCRGTKNKPVSLGQVLGWRKMRRFKPRSLVIEALKKSTFLEVIDDKLIRRRVAWDGSWRVPGDAKDPSPLYREPWTDADFPSDGEGDWRETRLTSRFSDESSVEEAVEEEAEEDDLAPPPGYKYNKLGALVQIRPHTAKKPTGLEEYFAEAPMTAEESLKTKETYGEDIGIVNSIEIAIQRYFHNRKLDQDSRRCLEAFLRFGGVSVSPKPFARLDRQHLDELDVADKKAALATHHIMPDKFDDKAWRLDFLHAAKGFLSSYYPNHFAQDFDDAETLILTACKVIINFYNYLLYFEVCSDKDVHDSILQSRYLAQKIAPVELMTVLKLPRYLPGRWTKAVARIWDLNYADDTLPPEDTDGKLSIDEAKKIFVDGFKSCPSDALVRFYLGHILQTPDCWHKRVRVLFKGHASVEIVTINAASNNDEKRTSVGFAVCKPWWNPGNDIYDIPEAHVDKPKYLEYLKEPIELWIDNIGLSKLMPEMKLEGKMMHLDFIGLGRIWVIGGNVKAYCSFYTITLNDLDARKALKAPHLEEVEVHNPDNTSKPITVGWDIPEPQPYSV